MKNDFKYDVAFSFLAEDEELVSLIDQQLRDRYKTYIYSKMQEELAGSDGMENLSDVFKNQTNLNVIFYRSKWGNTPWTAVECDGIKDSIFSENSNWNRLLIVNLELSSKLPTWIPETHIYFDFDHFGLEKLIGVIEFKIESLGGKRIPDDAVSFAIREDNKNKTEREIKQCLESVDSYKDASKCIQELIDLVKTKRESLKTKSTSFGLGAITDYNKDKLNIIIEAIQLDIQWITRYFDINTDALLYMKVLDPIDAPILQYHMVDTDKYQFHMNSMKQIGWKSVTDDKFYTTSELSEKWFKTLITRVIERKKTAG